MQAKQRRARPRLDRRNAIKNIDYDASSTSTSSSSSSSSSTLTLDDLSIHTSFRVRGQEGEFDIICRNLGLSGPEDFAIPVDAWRSSKARDLTPRSSLQTAFLAPNGDAGESSPRDGGGLAAGVDSIELESGSSISNGSSGYGLGGLEVRNRATSCRTRFKHDTTSAPGKCETFWVSCETDNPRSRLQSDAGESPRDGGGLAAGVDGIELESGSSILNGSSGYGLGGLEDRDRVTSCRTRFKHESGGSTVYNSRPSGETFSAKARGDRENRETDNAGGGIRGLRPPVLTPPPVLLRPAVDHMSSTWDLLNSFCPQEVTGGDKESPVRPSNEKDWSGGDDEKVSKERTSHRKGDSESYLSTPVEDEESEDKDGVGSILSAKILEPVHNVSPNGSFRRRITSWQKGDLLGSGSFGTVYEGFTDDGFFFAIKEVSLLDQGSQGKQSLLQLEQEISLLSRFEHENIVRYLGTDKDDKKLYIFLELMTKGSLATLYHKYNLRDSQVSAYTRQILNGLKYLHDQNVVHRDIKCANILVDASGAVKLADFGLAKATKMNDAKSSKGTAFWMAPEVVNLKNRSYGLAADIWSLGCTVLEMLTRRPPYSHLEGIQALFRIGKGEPPPVPDSLSREARDLILSCLQVNPNDRPSAARLLDHPFVRKPSITSGFASPRFNNTWP